MQCSPEVGINHHEGRKKLTSTDLLHTRHLFLLGGKKSARDMKTFEAPSIILCQKQPPFPVVGNNNSPKSRTNSHPSRLVYCILDGENNKTPLYRVGFEMYAVFRRDVAAKIETHHKTTYYPLLLSENPSLPCLPVGEATADGGGDRPFPPPPPSPPPLSTTPSGVLSPAAPPPPPPPNSQERLLLLLPPLLRPRLLRLGTKGIPTKVLRTYAGYCSG